MSPEVEHLQKEFEELLAQLEQLRSINQLTDENSANANKTIDAVEEFVASINMFKNNLENDFEDKKASLEETEKAVKSVIKELDKKISQYESKLGELHHLFQSDTSKVINEAAKKIESDFDRLSQNFAELSDKTNKLVEQNHGKYIDQSSEKMAALSAQLDRLENDLKSSKKRQLIMVGLIVLCGISLAGLKLVF